MALSPEARRLRARIAGYRLAAQRDPRDYTAAARAAFMTRFERDVDPAGDLAPSERQRRAAAAKRAYFAQLSYRSARKRAKRA
jgi:hypothetical protein